MSPSSGSRAEFWVMVQLLYCLHSNEYSDDKSFDTTSEFILSGLDARWFEAVCLEEWDETKDTDARLAVNI